MGVAPAACFFARSDDGPAWTDPRDFLQAWHDDQGRAPVVSRLENVRAARPRGVSGRTNDGAQA